MESQKSKHNTLHKGETFGTSEDLEVCSHTQGSLPATENNQPSQEARAGFEEAEE